MIALRPLAEQGLPDAGRGLLATFDAAHVVVWQAHRPEVAARILAGDGPAPTGPDAAWRLDRTTRMRLSLPSLLWRNGWATRAGRERILAVKVRRAGFDEILRRAVPGENDPEVYASAAAWRLATRFATATIAWHADHDPSGAELVRQTPRIGLRDRLLQTFATEWVAAVEDWTGWVDETRATRSAGTPVPVVAPYPAGA